MANQPISSFPSASPLQLTDKTAIARLVGPEYKNFSSTMQDIVNLVQSNENHYVIGNVTNRNTGGTISVTPQTRYFFNSLNSNIINFPGVADGVIMGQVIELQIIGSGANIINAPAGGYFRNDNAYWISFEPRQYAPPSTSAGQLIMDFTYYNANVWTYSFRGPFSGYLNGTPLLGTFLNGEFTEESVAESDGFVEIFSISTKGDLLRNDQVVALKGTFKNPGE